MGTAVFFAIASTLFAIAGRRAGASAVNRSRLLVAALIAIAIYWVTRGELIPAGLSNTVWLWLAASGIIGLAVGDDLLVRAYVLIGPALSMLIFALVPAIAAGLGWVFLDETLSTSEISGIAVTLFGVGWVVTAPKQRAAQSRGHDHHGHGWGLVFALGGACGQALGLVTAKVGLSQGASSQGAHVTNVRRLGLQAIESLCELVSYGYNSRRRSRCPVNESPQMFVSSQKNWHRRGRCAAARCQNGS